MKYGSFICRCSLGLAILTMLGSSSFAMDKENRFSTPKKACTPQGKSKRSAESLNKPTCYESAGIPQPAPQPPPLFPMSEHLRFALGLEGSSEKELEKSCLDASAAEPTSAKKSSGRKRKSHNGRDAGETKHAEGAIFPKDPHKLFLSYFGDSSSALPSTSSSSKQNASPLKRKSPHKQEISDSTPAAVKKETLEEQDTKIATILLENYRKRWSETNTALEHFPTVTTGFTKYLSDRRQRKIGLTRQQLLDFLFPEISKSESSTDQQKELERELESLSFEESWLKSFGPASSLQDQNPIPTPDLTKFEILEGRKDKNSIPRGGGVQSSVKEIKRPDGKPTVIFKTYPKYTHDYEPSEAYRRARREVIAYRLSQALGLDLVEETKVMLYKGKIGSVRNRAPTGFYPRQDSEQIEENKEWRQALSELRTFDFIGGFTDRNQGNLFFNETTHKIQGVDFDDSPMPIPLRMKGFLSGGMLPETYSPNLAKAIMELKFAEFSEKMSDSANPLEIESLWMRIQIVRADIQRKSPPQ